MAQNTTWERGEDRSTVIANRHFAGILPRGIYKGFDITTNVSSLFLNLEKGSDDTSLILTPEGIRIEEDADIPTFVSIDTGDGQPRIDLVICTHQYTVTNDPAVYSVVKGTPAGSPVPPALPSEPPFNTILATISVGIGVTDILPGDVTLAPKVAISLTTVPFVTLSDISAVQSDAFAAMVAPSGANPIATIADVTTTVAAKKFTRSSFDEVRVAEKGTPDDNVQVFAGRLHDLRNISSADIVAVASLGPFGTTNPAQERIDLVVVDPDTQAISIVTGVDAPPSATVPTYPLDKIVLAEILIDEDTTVVINTADITDVRPIVHRNVPNFEDIPNMTTDIEDALTGAASPDSSNVFQTANDLDPIGAAFAYSRVLIDNGITSSDQSVLRDGAIITCHNMDYTVLRTVRLASGDLVADGGGGIGPGGLETGGTFIASTFYHIYLIAKSTSAAPGFAAALVISTSPNFPDLGASPAFDGFDIWRRIVGITTNSSIEFIRSKTSGGMTMYLSGNAELDVSIQIDATAGNSADFTLAPNPASFATVVPETSRRCIISCPGFSSAAPRTLFTTDGDDPSTTSGGRRVHHDAGVTAEDNYESFWVDLDSQQRARFRLDVGGQTRSSLWLMDGYEEEL